MTFQLLNEKYVLQPKMFNIPSSQSDKEKAQVGLKF